MFLTPMAEQTAEDILNQEDVSRWLSAAEKVHVTVQNELYYVLKIYFRDETNNWSNFIAEFLVSAQA